MKCGFCGKELEQGAEFCPECGMILSLGGVIEEPEENTVEAEVPEYTPNVFRAMDFEVEESVPAKELEINDEEETAPVVEIIPEYVEPVEELVEEVAQEPAEEESAEEPEQFEAEQAEEIAEPEQVVSEEVYDVPEYDPNAQVSAEFMQQIEEEKAQQAQNETAEEAENDLQLEQQETVEEISDKEPEFAPPEYEPSYPVDESEVIAAEQEATEEAVVYEIAEEEAAAEPYEEAYPIYNDEENACIPEEELTEDASIIAALFESEESEKIEDITPVEDGGKKASKNNFLSVVVLVVALVAVIIGGGYVFKYVLPKVVDTNSTTTAATEEKVDATTTKAPEKTTKESTTEKTTENTTENTTTTEAEETTTKPTTTKPTTTKPTTTKPTTTEATTSDEGEAVVKEPSSYNVDEVPFFPIESDISIKAGPSASSADMITHPYGYPVYAYAKEGDFYYVHSPYLDYMGWVSGKDVEEYKEDTTETEEVTQEATDAQVSDGGVIIYETPYTAVINSSDGLKFRNGPGVDYGSEIVVPGGFYVTVSGYSAENPGWVYVRVEDSRYPYGSPEGWVLEEYLY